MRDFIIRTEKDLEAAVEECGILPLFENPLVGFSVEEHAAPEVWFAGGEGIWEWKGPVIRGTGCAYGKFFGNKAVFISRKWFPDFANWRRDGYDFDARFDDELASYADKRLYDLLDAAAPVMSDELKKAGRYGKDGNKGFETILTRLQAQGYVVTSDFIYRKDRFGHPYGWGVAQYSTPEKFFGKAFTDAVYRRQPEASFARILAHVQSLLPDEDPQEVERYLTRGAGRPEGRRDWLVPSNPKYFDVVKAFAENEVIHWKQGNDNIRPGDHVFLYVGAPYSAILYHCEVTETDIPYTGHNEHVNITKLMMIKRLQVFDPAYLNRPVLKNYDVTAVRSTRSMPARLVRDIRDGRVKQ